MNELRQALNARRSRRRRGRKPLFGLSWDVIEDKVIDFAVGQAAPSVGELDTDRISKDVGDWIDDRLKLKGLAEVASDIIIDHIVEPLVEDLLDEAISTIQKRAEAHG